jgi:hypothetical protein
MYNVLLAYPTKSSFHFLWFNWNFQQQKIFKIQYLPYLKSNFFEITFIKSYSSKAFKKY